MRIGTSCSSLGRILTPLRCRSFQERCREQERYASFLAFPQYPAWRLFCDDPADSLLESREPFPRCATRGGEVCPYEDMQRCEGCDGALHPRCVFRCATCSKRLCMPCESEHDWDCPCWSGPSDDFAGAGAELLRAASAGQMIGAGFARANSSTPGGGDVVMSVDDQKAELGAF
jgi:hypothetical protein